MDIRKLTSTAVLVGLFFVASTVSVTGAEQHGELKSSEVKALVMNAKTPADHLKLARHYTAMAEKHEVEAKEHDALAIQYTNSPTGHEMKHPMSGQTAAHCKSYAEHCRKAASEMRALAAAHSQMAKNSE